ncbi:MAG: Ig-like domain repeat protein [Candidatus Omnitrophica bacterium]|nr:Ig-like domain repeat protein [Candidatus Omnitrophota bacterium]
MSLQTADSAAKYLTVRCWNGSVQDYKSIDFTDTTLPTIPEVSVENGTGYTNKTDQLYASWTASNDTESGLAEYQYAIGTSPNATDIKGWTSVGKDTYVTASLLNLTEPNTYYFRVRAINGLGLWSESSQAITIDTTSPQTQALVTEGFCYKDSVTVTLSVSDALSGEDKTYYSTDNSYPTLVYTAPFTLSTEGSYNIQYYSIDKAGNIESVKTTQIKVDVNAPTGSISINSGATFTNSVLVTLILSAEDSGCGVVMMRFSNDNTWDALKNPWEPYVALKSWSLGSTTDGTKSVYVRFKDRAGNISLTYKDTIILDTTAPSVPGQPYLSSGNSPNKSGTFSISWSSSTDSLSGLLEYEVFRNGIKIGTVATNTFSETSLPQGSYSYYIRAVDNIGNLSSFSPSSVPIIVDKTVPKVTNKTISPQKVGQPLVYKAQVTDDISGINKVTLLIKQADGTFKASGALTYDVASGLYQITKPAKTTPTTITYKIKAVDNAGNIKTTVAYTLSVVK